MLLLRERFQVCLLFIGIFCGLFGLVLLNPFGAEEKEISPPVQKWGVWKDGGITNEARREFAPWVIGVGVASLFGSFLLRERH